MRQFLRPGWVVGHLLVVLAALVCLRLAWWQLERSEEIDGTVQNVGYALLWPAFGVSFIVMWIRFLGLERQRAEAEDAAHDAAVQDVLAEAESLTAGAAGPTEPGQADGTMVGGAESSVPAGAIGIVGDETEDEDDPELIAYNRALAALAERDRRAR